MQKIAIIVPCFNEASRLDIGRYTSFLERNPNIDLCFVNDGSADGTAKVIDEAADACPEQITTLHLEKNLGKAETVRQGILKMNSSGDYSWLGFWDADLASPLEEIHHLISYANDEVSVLMCSRIKRLGAQVKRHPIRHILSRVMAMLVSCVLKMDVYDAQCGAKLIRCGDVDAVFSEPFITKWIFDVEIIARIEKKYSRENIYRHIIEVPVYTWNAVPGSKFKPNHMAMSLIELARIKWKYK